ncbi:unnamed protein product [Rhizophagus irregularis]|nr:unnamed protein product [Rhizophagus irregularis]CAB4493913.1 unnamed protein product [Rhizophagus irregularis]
MKYYELCKLDETIPLKKQNPFASKPPFRLGIASTSESGKTSIIVYLLLGNEELWEAVQCFYEFIARDKEAS